MSKYLCPPLTVGITVGIIFINITLILPEVTKGKCALFHLSLKECHKNAFHEFMERLDVFSFIHLQTDRASVSLSFFFVFFFGICL